MPFINIELEKLLNEDGWMQSVLDTGPAIQKRVQLPEPQMRMFSVLDITKFPNGTIWLDFLSDKYAPTKEAMDFMAYCFRRWGLDSKGRGLPKQSDVEALRNGTFGRTWLNVKMTQVKLPERFSLTIVLRIIIDNKDMSSFIKDLTKGFIRSAVNQVGRDGGRVISNSLYNGRNYVPVANVTPSPNYTQGQDLPNEENIPNNAVITTKPLSGFKILIFVIASFMFPVGTIIVFAYGIIKYFNTTAKVKWVEQVPQYVSDRRYKTNSRFAGYSIVHHSKTIAAPQDIVAINKHDGIILIAISLIAALIIGVSLIYG